MARYQHNTNDVRRRARIKDKKVILYTRDADDNYTPLHHGTLWAYVRQLSGDEINFAKQDFREEDTQFIVNYRPDYSNWDAIAYNGRFYNVTRVDTFEGYKRDLTVYANTIGTNPNPNRIIPWTYT